MDEILVANFMVFHDVVEARRVRPRHRRRGVGRRLLPPREPGAQAHGLRLDDRLRRLAADARWRRAGGVPDRRLQRRDDRAHRALPAAARPGDLRRRPRRHRARRLRSRPARHPRLDRAALLVLGVRDRVRPDGAGRGPRGAPPGARLPRRRARGHRHGRRVRRRRGAAAAGHRELSRCRPTRPGPAHDRGGGAADRPGARSTRPRASRSAPSCRTSTGTSWPRTSRSSRAA